MMNVSTVVRKIQLSTLFLTVLGLFQLQALPSTNKMFLSYLCDVMLWDVMLCYVMSTLIIVEHITSFCRRTWNQCEVYG